MPDFRIVPPGEVDVLVFDNGYKATIQREMTAGDEERHRNFMLAVKVGRKGEPDEAVMHLGHLNLVEINLLELVEPNGTRIPVTPALIASLDRATFKYLREEIEKRNPPLVER